MKFSANGHWTIYSLQKTLPILGLFGSVAGAHNYLALVAPDGTIDCEMHGAPSDNLNDGQDIILAEEEEESQPPRYWDDQDDESELA